MPETFISLARKWRPRRLAELTGQEYVVRALQNAARDDRMHHALLFSGTRGIGKTTLARIVAMLINCEARTEDNTEPCLECSFCKEIMAGTLTDVIEQDAASHTQVDKMRDLLESAAYAPARARCKVFIIDEVHMLTKQAFNAMLKTLEEPPPHVKFILATTDPQKLPATVRSRCLCFSLLPLTQEQIVARLRYILQEEGIPCAPAALAAVARLGSGSMRDALSILDQAVAHRDGELKADDVRRITGDIGVELLAEMLRAVADNNAEKIHDLTQEHIAHHISFDSSLARVAELVYKIALVQMIPKAPASDDEEEAALVREMSGRFSAEQLQVLYEIALRARQQLPLAPDEATGFTMTLLRMVLFAPVDAATAATAGATAPAAPPTTAGKPPASAAAKSTEDKAPPAAPAPAPAEDGPSWENTVANLKPAAAKALAEHCYAEHYDDTRAELVLDKSQAAMLDKFLPKLEAALKKLHGDAFEVKVRVGDDDTAGAAQREAQADQANNSELTRRVKKSFPAAEVAEDSVRTAE